MKNQIRVVSLAVFATTIFLTAPALSFGQSNKVKLNENGFAQAEALITQGNLVVDKKNDWGDHHPTSQQENDFLRAHGFAEYGKWHLGMAANRGENSKARYKFPFGDFKNIHRCGLLAVKSRAHQFGYSDIENAAARLLEMMEQRR